MTASPPRLSGLIIGCLVAGPLLAAEAFYDYAEVTRVQPLKEPVQATAPPGPCAREAKPEVTMGPGRGGAGVHTLLETLRRDLDRLADLPCRSPPPAIERIVGYRVTYRYGDSEYVRVLTSDPGPRLRVRVRLDPGP